jgi:hypothetical protein
MKHLLAQQCDTMVLQLFGFEKKKKELPSAKDILV